MSGPVLQALQVLCSVLMLQCLRCDIPHVFAVRLYVSLTVMWHVGFAIFSSVHVCRRCPTCCAVRNVLVWAAFKILYTQTSSNDVVLAFLLLLLVGFAHQLANSG